MIWKLSTGKDYPSAISFFFFLAYWIGFLPGKSQSYFVTAALGVQSMITDEDILSKPLLAFLRSKVRRITTQGLAARSTFILYPALKQGVDLCPGSDVNSLCLLPGPPFSLCCWQLTLNFFCNPWSSELLACLFANLLWLFLNSSSRYCSCLKGQR